MTLNALKTTFDSYSKITLKDMNRVNLMDRVETKFVLAMKQLPDILSRLSDDYSVVSIDGNIFPSYKTVYFDTDSLFFYKEHHRKRANRYKVRYRNYVESNLTFLEVKHKQNGRVDKQRIQVSNDQYHLGEKDKRFLREANIEISDLKQQLTNVYNRITLVSNRDVERVTFDLNINFCYQRVHTDLDNVVIVELKQSSLSRTTPIYQILKQAQVKPYSVSKYCLGIIKTHGQCEVKHNRFKKKLIQLNKISSK